MFDDNPLDDYGDIWSVSSQKSEPQAAAPDTRALEAYREGCNYMDAGRRDLALTAFFRALHFAPDMVNAHLRIARLAPEEGTRRKHLERVLALDPENTAARRMLLILDGAMTAEESAALYNVAAVKKADAPVSAQSETLLCPVCRGNLTTDDQAGTVYCRFCGFQETLQRGQVSSRALQAALAAKQRSTTWIIGKRVLHCNECGAEWTLSARTLSAECRFCGSMHVVQQDAVKSFRQPDGIVPFAIAEEQAHERIQMQLDTRAARLRRVLDDNRAAAKLFSGSYLPFWVFMDAQPASIQLYTPTVLAKRKTLMTGSQADLPHDVAICAAKSPPGELTERLGIYDLKYAVPYQPGLLAKHPAELYSVDFDSASIAARGVISQALRGMYPEDETRVNLGQRMRAFTEFRLLLFPVWIVTIHEEDGDLRPALVNGQSGQVVFGKAQKPGS